MIPIINNRSFYILNCLILIFLLHSNLLASPGTIEDKDDWRHWRGPNKNGIAAQEQSPAISWSENKNIKWKAKVPGRGHCSPIVIGNKVFLATAMEEQQIQSVLCYSRENGKLIWEREIHRGNFAEFIHKKNTHASQTLASDGEYIFVTFNNSESIFASALDFEGKIVWQKNIAAFKPESYKFGYGASPTIYKSSVIISLQCDTNALITALDCKTGQEIWKTERYKCLNWASPIVAYVAGKHQLLISGNKKLSSYNPDNGKLLWAAPGAASATCVTMVWTKDLVFASGGYPKSETICVKADGSEEKVWRNSSKMYEPSMLIVDEYLYAIDDKGIAMCWLAASGERMWKQRMAKSVSSSPILAGGHIYLMDLSGNTYVFKPNPNKYEEVSQNKLGDDAYATPAICGSQIFARVGHQLNGKREEYLYCIEKE